jgi:hypothetical protein
MKTAIRLALATAGTTLLLAAQASAGMLDQQQTTSNGWETFDVAGQAAQIFTAGITGGLDRVDLPLTTAGSADPLTVQITDVSAGVPGTTVLASALIPVSAAGSDHPPTTWASAIFLTPAPVRAGTQYAILPVWNGGGEHWEWGGEIPTGTYPGGYTLDRDPRDPPTVPWFVETYDMAFKTYVVPTPPPTGRRHAALRKCKKKARKHDWSHKKLKKCKRKARKLPV